ncbi:MAG TPA: HEAT repeat domain-containing protein, partial [Polyangiaceae bacterium]|nr:HEAT repeat domain-containing protein [Polyangiaceae bacterium]
MTSEGRPSRRTLSPWRNGFGRRGSLAAAFVVLSLAPNRAPALAWPDVVERVQRDLSASDAAIRRAAVRDLVKLGRVHGGPLALAALDDPDDEVRLSAAEATIRLRVARASDVVVTWLNAPDTRLRREACEVVRALPNPSTIAPLARTLGDPDAEVRAAAADALGHQDAAEAVPPLLGRLDDSTPVVRITIVEALAHLGDVRAVVPLIGKVEDSSVEVRNAVVRALGDLGDARASPALVLTLRDPNPEVRREALVALGRLRAVDSVDAIAPFAVDRSAPLRLAALETLGRLATPDALRILIGALGTADDAAALQHSTPVRDALVRAGQAAVAPLRALLAASAPPATASSAAWVLGALHAHSTAGVVVDALRRGSLPPAAALHALAGAGTAAEVPVVLEFLTDESPAVRSEAADAAVALLDPREPDGRAVEPLAAALRDRRPSNEERARFVQALGRTGAPRAARILADLAGARDVRLRLAAIDALGSLQSGEADDALLAALASPEADVRLHSAASLSEAGSARAREALLDLLRHGDEVDRASALTALGGVLSRFPTDAAVAQLAGEFELAAGPERDALIETIGRAPTGFAARAIARIARSEEPLDRRQAAVLCAAQASGPARRDALEVARELIHDPDSGVRAQAAWSLGVLGDVGDSGPLLRLTRSTDGDEGVNATAALGRIEARSVEARPRAAAADAPRPAPGLCALVTDVRPFVRANALAGLALEGARC